MGIRQLGGISRLSFRKKKSVGASSKDTICIEGSVVLKR
jgi:hypothetical protein